MSARAPGATSILQAVEKRGETDTRPSYFVHVVLPLLLTAGAVLVVLGALVWQIGGVPVAVSEIPDRALGVIVTAVVLAALLVLAGLVLSVRGWYLIISRRNDHLARDRVLRQGLLDYARRLAETRGDEKAGEHLETMQRLHNEALLEENERPAVVHLLLYFFTQGLWGLYVLWFLIKDVPQHARRQARFVREARSLFDAADEDPDAVPPIEPVDERSFLGAAALWIFVPIAGQLLVTWWIYQDPVEHFDRQWSHEDELVELARQEEAPEAPAPEASQGEGDAPDEEGAGPDQDEEEPEFTVWACGECETKFKVPPKRPVRVTCKSCGNKEILEE